MGSQPLSLEDQCFLHLICHLEEYTPEMLASLPLHLRRRLLLNLPAVDVCQLEDTAVTEGIDMEVSVWKELLEKQGVTCGEPHFKQKYFGEIYWYFFRGQLSDSSRWLFSAPGCLGVTNWEYFQHAFTPVTPGGLYSFPSPSRHVQYSTKECLMTQLLSILVPTGKCNFWPERIHIACSHFVDTDLWKSRGVVLSSLLSEFFSKVPSLVFNTDDNHGVESFNVPQFILELALSRPPIALTSLSVTGTPEFVCHTLAEASTFFSPGCYIQGRHLLRSLYHQMLPHTVPYNGLTSISIGGYGELHPAEEDLLHKHVESIVLHQSALESFSLSCSSTSPHAFSLYSALGSLFRQPQFRSLKIEYANMDWKDLSVLVSPFLSSSLGQGSEIELCFRMVTFNLDALSEVAINSCSSSLGKTLTFENIVFKNTSHIKPFFGWLSRHHCLQLLSSFEFTYGWYWSGDEQSQQNLPGSAMTLVAEKQAAAQLESFTIGGISLLFERSPVVPFINLFSAPRLRKVSLCECQISTDGLLSSLTQGLLNQVPLGELDELCLDDNGLGKSTSAQFQDFANAIFSLPQLTKLTLSLINNELKCRHFTLMHGAWKVNGNGKRIKALDVHGNQYEENVVELREIAVSGNFL